MVCIAKRSSHFFHEQSFLLERTTNRETMVVQIMVFGRHYFENEPSVPVTPREMTDRICCQNNILQQIECRSIYEEPAVHYYARH